MYRDLIERAQMLDFPIFALLVFLAVFLVLTARALGKHDFSEVAALPLSPDDDEVRRE